MTAGETYTLKVRARNEHGFSEFSDTVAILAAEEPIKPEAPTTAISGQSVLVSWQKPDERGSPITHYEISIRQSDEVTFSVELASCDGSDSGIVSDAQCLIPISTLRGAPFNIDWGSSIYAKVVAGNSYGDSLVSDAGNGATILTNPDAPLNLANKPDDTNSNQISITWQQGLFAGGSPVLDYKISYDQASGNWVEVTTLTDTTYTLNGLTPGDTYAIVV